MNFESEKELLNIKNEFESEKDFVVRLKSKTKFTLHESAKLGEKRIKSETKSSLDTKFGIKTIEKWTKIFIKRTKILTEMKCL